MSVDELARWASDAPAGTMIAASTVAECLAAGAQPARAVADADVPQQTSWREKLWTVPGEMRFGVRELAEALDRPVSWVYRSASRLPHRKFDSELVFIAQEIRAWLNLNESIIVRGPASLRLLERKKAS